MKRKLLILGVLFSLAINVAVLATIGYHRIGKEEKREERKRGERKPHHASMNYLYKELALSESQTKEMESLKKSLESKMAGIKKALREKRVELINLVETPEPHRKKINEKLSEIESLQGALQRHVIDNLIQQKEILTPEQQKKFFSIISRKIHPGGRHRDKKLLQMIEGRERRERESKHE